MSALAYAEQESLFGSPPAPAAAPATGPAPAPDPFDGPTLDDVLSHAWEALGAQVAAACPVCGGEIEPHGHTAGGRCSSCGATVD